MACPPRSGDVGCTRRTSGSQSGIARKPPALFVPPTSTPIRQFPCRWKRSSVMSSTPRVVAARLIGGRQPARERPDVRRVAAAASTDVADTFVARELAEFKELATRNLDRLEIVRECRVAREAVAFLGRAECGRLGRKRYRDCISHLAKQGQHPTRVLFAVRTDGSGSQIGHDPGTLRRRPSVSAVADQGTKTHGCDNGKPAVDGAPKRDLHLSKMEECLENEQFHARVLEQPDLLCKMVARLAERLYSLTFQKLGP